MYQCADCDYRSARIWCINRHRTNKHGSKQHEGSAPATYQSTSMERNQVGGSALTKSNQEQGDQSGQQRVPIE